jgi:copper transport protein
MAAKAVLYLALPPAIGACVARWLLLARIGSGVHGISGDHVERSLWRVGLTAAVIVLVSLPLRAWTHTVAAFGLTDSFRWDSLHLVAVESQWGTGWQVQAAVAFAWVLAYASIRMTSRIGWALATLAGVGFCMALPLTGHAAGHPARVALHAFHILAASAWVGTLTAVVFMRLPAAGDRRDRGDVRLAMLAGFAPIAFPAAASAVLAGLTATWIYLGAWSNLWTTEYGQLLAVKAAFVCCAGGCGYLNWRQLHRARPFDSPGRVMLVEVAFAAVVVLVTAMLTEQAHP